MSPSDELVALHPSWLPYFVDVLYTRFGLVTNDARRSMVEHAVLRVTDELGLTSPLHLLPRVREGAVESDAVRLLLRHVTVHESYFFRDDRAIAALRETVLPMLIERRRARRRLRVWSAGCAGGEEAFTLAILLRAFPELDRWELDILGTDLDAHVVERARTRAFAGGSLRACSDADLQSYFERPEGRSFHVRERYASFVRFDVDNLMDSNLEAADGAFDLVLCRNVALYFDLDGAALLHAKIARYLADDGVALLGVLEPRPNVALVPADGHAPGLPLYRRAGLEDSASARPALGRASGIDDAVARRAPLPRVAPTPVATRPRAAPVEASSTAPTPKTPSIERVPPSHPTERDADAWIADARGHADHGRHHAALEVVQRCIERFPLDPRAYMVGALVTTELDRHDHAEMFLRRVLYLVPDCADAHERMALVLGRRGDVRGSERASAEARRCADTEGGTAT